MYVEVDKDSQQSTRILLQRADALSTQAYNDIIIVMNAFSPINMSDTSSGLDQNHYINHYLRQLVWYCTTNYHQYTTTYQKHVFHIAALAHCVKSVGQ